MVEENEEGDPEFEASEEEPEQSEAFVCEHCHRTLKSPHALTYHIDNFVCRPDVRPGGKPQAGRRKGKGNSKKVRGSLEDRTCPDCGRVFTSAYGCQYHRGT